MLRGEQLKITAVSKVEPISQHVIKRSKRLMIFSTSLQLLAIFVVICFLSANDAFRRARFLAASNGESIGLMVATGDIFQMKSLAASFKNEDTPRLWILNNRGESATTTPAEDPELPQHKENKFIMNSGGLFYMSSHPITYGGNRFGTLVLENKIRINDWLILIPIFMAITLLFSFIQTKSLRDFSMNLASSISGVTHFFDNARTEDSLEKFAQNRSLTSFTEIESMAARVHSMLLDLIRGVEAEKEHEKYKAIAKVTAHVAHDLRHPLSVFEAVSKANDWIDFQRIRGELCRSLARIDNMIDGLRNTDLSRLVRLSPNSLQLGDIVSEILPIARQKNTLVRCEGNESIIRCLMDHSKLVRAIHNLLFNAIEAGASEIIMICNHKDENYCLEVIDNGPGVPKHLVPRLFSEGATFGKSGGTGLGLNFVRSTILSHRGTISYDRRDHFTVFTITLPQILNSSDLTDESEDIQTVGTDSTQNERRMPRVFVKFMPEKTNQEVKKQLLANGIETLKDPEQLCNSDILYTDDHDLILESMSRYHSTTLHHSPNHDSEEITKKILGKYSLKSTAMRNTPV